MDDLELIEKLDQIVKESHLSVPVDIRKYTSGYDNFSLLHNAAKCYRYRLCSHLIGTIRIGLTN